VKLKLIKTIDEAKGTKSFFWKPEKKVDWIPGQYFYYTLPKLNYEDSRGDTRQFTISSSPTEGGIIQLTTRFPDKMSGFKSTLLNLRVGTVVEGDGPSGILKFDESEKDKTHVFLAGGVGITPFRSFIKYNIDKKISAKTHLIFSNSQVTEIVFRKELESWANKYDFFRLDITITQPEQKNWQGLKGRIDLNMVKKLTKGYGFKNTAFWVAGPSSFVYAMEGIIDNFKILPENKHIEIFTGY
jgi:ferredoxin-NADP reductase